MYPGIRSNRRNFAFFTIFSIIATERIRGEFLEYCGLFRIIVPLSVTNACDAHHILKVLICVEFNGMKPHSTAKQYGVRITVLICLCGFLFAGIFYSQFAASDSAVSASNVGPTPKKQRTAAAKKAKYSEFPHDVKAHKMECASCHKFPSSNWNKVRSGDTAFPDITDYPKHESCLNCHKQQFFKGAKPKICSICHTNPSPRDSSRHPFPNPRETFDTSPKGKTAVSDFSVGFPHDKHIEIVSRNIPTGNFIAASFVRSKRLAGEESCSVCHKTLQPQGDSADEYVTKPPAKLGDGYWLKKGTFKTAPIGHTTCFTCHSADTGILPIPETCSACHKLKMPEPASDFDAKLASTMGIDDKVTLMSWRKRASAGTFRHEFFAHVDLDCAACHSVATMNTADPATKKVRIATCATCHVTPTSDEGGALNFEVDSRKAGPKFDCVKCHISFGKAPIPESHLKAIATAAGK
jgi:hypothetical protein